MPLLTSPIDGSPMKQINRYGIEIDVCPTTGGVWLDKGELEKLMAIIREAAAEEQGNAPPQNYREPPPAQQQRAVYEEPRQPKRDERYRDDQRRDDHRYEQKHDPRYDRHYDSQHGHGKYPHKKKSRFTDILDIFDF